MVCREGVRMTYHHDQVTSTIIECIIRVHKTLGPGFSESIYRKSLMIELKLHKLDVETEKEVRVYYGDSEVGCYRLDLVVNQKIIVELKTVDAINQVHYAQARSYMKALKSNVAILVNFSRERADFRRLEN